MFYLNKSLFIQKCKLIPNIMIKLILTVGFLPNNWEIVQFPNNKNVLIYKLIELLCSNKKL